MAFFDPPDKTTMIRRSPLPPRAEPIKRKSARSTKRRATARRKGDPKYLDWIRERPCLICWPVASEANDFASCMKRFGLTATLMTEAAHVGDRGLGQKCSDRETIPLCANHHRLGKDAHHVLGKGFWAHHKLDRDVIVSGLNRLYEEQ